MSTPHSSSNTGNNVHFWHMSNDWMEWGYPLDTVRIEIKCPISLVDRESGTFESWNRKSLTTNEKVNGITGERKHETLVRKFDGLKVIICESRTMVEVSLPRFFGYENHCLNLVPKDGLRVLLTNVSKNLLPETVRAGGHSWILTRVDIAIDFPGEILALVNYYRDVKFPGGQKSASVQSRTQMTWEYCGLLVKLYGKTEEVRGRSKGGCFMPENHCRFEIQLSGAVPLAFLAEEMPRGEEVQVRVKKERSISRNQGVSMEAVDLFRFGLDVMSLLTPPVEKVYQVKSCKDLGALAMSLYPAMKQTALVSFKGATLRRALAMANSLKFEESGMDLVELVTGISSKEWVDLRGNMFHRCKSSWKKPRKKRFS